VATRRHELTVQHSAATNNQTGEGVAIKKVTNVFSKKILAKRALREIKLLQHFRGMTRLHPSAVPRTDLHRAPKCMVSLRRWMSCLPKPEAESCVQITCLYDMDIPRPDNFNEAYLYEGTGGSGDVDCTD